MRTLAILGSTGSIGRQTLQLVDQFPDHFKVVALVAGSDEKALREQVAKYSPSLFGLAAITEHEDLRTGASLLLEAAVMPEADMIVNAVVGSRGLSATLAALSANKLVALANKESLVAGGELIAALVPNAADRTQRIRPVDSEHAALKQALAGVKPEHIQKLILTASGGPFRGKQRDALREVTTEQALAHPTWRMGKRISIDSATLVNKGLELIEARWLFDLSANRLDALCHPQSLVHAIVECVDGSQILQAAKPDMRLPIATALFDEERPDIGIEKLDLAAVGHLEFEPIDHATFPAVRLALQALEAGGSAPCTYNAADEEAVDAFLKGQIGFLDIVEIIQQTLETLEVVPVTTLPELGEIERRARDVARGLIDKR
jgi:1-deoxy-D-xylulose-5-phosphate reductoisomerase